MNLQEFAALKSKVEKLQRDADRSAGALEQSLQRLRDEFGCASLKQARLKLKKLKRRLDRAASEYDSARVEFEDKYAGRLNDAD